MKTPKNKKEMVEEAIPCPVCNESMGGIVKVINETDCRIDGECTQCGYAVTA